MKFRETIGQAKDAAAAGAVGTNKSLMAYIKQTVTNLGDFSGQTNLQSLLAALGIPDVAGKSLYTCLITDRLDNATYGLSAIETLVDDIENELAKVPKSDSNVTWNVTALASINAEVDTALNTIVPASPTAGSLNDILSKAAGGNTFDKATDSLEAISDKVTDANTDLGDFSAQTNLQSLLAALGIPDVAAKPLYTCIITDRLDNATFGLSAIHTDTAPTVAGKVQMAVTTEDLNQGANTYDLLTGTTQRVLLEGLVIKMPTGAAGGALTSISIQTDDATPGVIISSVDGAVANLTSEAEISWTGAMLINVGTKIQLTIAGGAHGSEYITTIIAKYRAVVSGGTLA